MVTKDVNNLDLINHHNVVMTHWITTVRYKVHEPNALNIVINYSNFCHTIVWIDKSDHNYADFLNHAVVPNHRTNHHVAIIAHNDHFYKITYRSDLLVTSDLFHLNNRNKNGKPKIHNNFSLTYFNTVYANYNNIAADNVTTNILIIDRNRNTVIVQNKVCQIKVINCLNNHNHRINHLNSSHVRRMVINTIPK